MRLPLDQAQEAADACSAAVDRWLTWMSTAEEMKRGLSAGMRQTATYTRDTKVRVRNSCGASAGARAPTPLGPVPPRACAAPRPSASRPHPFSTPQVRANHFGFLLKKYIALFGEEDGKNLASADAGPLDEAYVGGGS